MSYLPDPAPVGPWDDPDESPEPLVPGVLFDDGPVALGRLWVVEELGTAPVEYTLYDRPHQQFGYCKPEAD